jgi:large subunit ribosomal protein L21
MAGHLLIDGEYYLKLHPAGLENVSTSGGTMELLTASPQGSYNGCFRLTGETESMYAIFRTGGKQYKASPGDVIRVERVAGDPGSTVEFNRVFAVRNEKLTLGTPLVENAKVTGKILTNDRAAKVRVLKYKRKKQYRRTLGHRQHFSQVLIENIVTA